MCLSDIELGPVGTAINGKEVVSFLQNTRRILMGKIGKLVGNDSNVRQLCLKACRRGTCTRLRAEQSRLSGDSGIQLGSDGQVGLSQVTTMV